MPGLPGSDPEKDICSVKTLFDDERFRPDMLKIYPTLVVGGTVLKKWADEGRYSPYSAEAAAEVISEFYRHIPKYVRVMRIQRDIPANRIEQGVRKSNLRELVEARIMEKGIIPSEIRYREIGLAALAKKRDKKSKLSDFRPERLDYQASGGREVFLSYENDENLIAGFLRLRFPRSSIREEITPETALVRELHVYGTEIPISGPGHVQHKGLGSNLLHEAEEVARENGKKKMAIISGVGVREYYRKRGYALEGPYMVKKLS
jgi:elongator complex protein 3